MADDPLFGFRPAGSSAPANDPLFGFKPSSAGAPAAPSGWRSYLPAVFTHVAADQPAWVNKPSPDTLPALDPRTATMGDYLAKASGLPHLAASGAGQIGSTAADYANVANNVYGQGGGLTASLKALYGDVTGQAGQASNYYPSLLAAEQAKTAAAQERLGTAGTIAASMTGGGPLLGATKGLGNMIAPYTGKWLGGALASTATGGGATAAGEIGRNENLSLKDIAIGGGLGFLGGVPGGIVDRGVLPTSPSAKSYFDQAEQAYKPLTQLIYDAKNEVHPALDVTAAKNAQRDWSGKRWDDASKTSNEIEALLDKPQLSANDIQQSQIYLRKKVINSPTADPNDKTYAGYYVDRLQHVLENGLPSTGVPQNLPPGVSPSNYAAHVKSAGDFLTGQANDMQRADVWKAVGETPAGKDIGTQAGSWLSDQAARWAAKEPGVWAKPGEPYYNATTALAKTTGQATPLSWYAKHFLLAPMAFTAAGEGLNAVTGGTGMGNQPWWARLGEEATAGLALSSGAQGYRALTGAANAAKQQAAEAALRQTIASRTMQNPLGAYAPLAPIAPATPKRDAFSDAIRTLIYSQGARGAY
jgi:hypothetical protein